MISDDLLKYVETLKSLEDTIELNKKISNLQNMAKENPVNTNIEMISLSNDISNDIANASKLVLESPNFKELTRKQRADIIREYFTTGSTVGYTLNTKLGYDVHKVVLKETGLLYTPVIGAIDIERQKAIIAQIIKFELDEDKDSVGVMHQAFNGFIPDATKDVLIKTAEKIQKSGKKVVGRRVIRSSNPCLFCVEMAEQRFSVGHNLERTSFHDNCRCGLIFEVQQ